MFPRWLRLSAWFLAFGLIVAALFVFVPLYRSLPDRGGRIIFPGLAGTSAIQRDRDGIVRISAHNRRDAAKLLGFAHTHDRFFQMDLLRRTAAGELAELFGPAALPMDREFRRHRLREVARAALEKLPEPQRELLEDYALGIAGGLFELESPPIEYLVLGTKPAPWKAEDSLLVVATLALTLQRVDGEPEFSRQVVRDVFAPGTAEFLLSAADDFEAALDESHIEAPARPDAPAYAPALPERSTAAAPPPPIGAPAPDTTSTDIGAQLFAAWAEQIRRGPAAAAGSHAFALRGRRGERAVALLANSLQLPLAIPNTWYRTELTWQVDPKRIRSIDGITLPGLPNLFAGSNGVVAWGFTPAAVDTVDLVVLETDPADPRRYRTPDGWRAFETRTETIAVRGAVPDTVTFDTTIWGPVVGPDHRGRMLALKWAMAEPAAYDLQFANLETVNSARAALAFAKSAGLPSLNIVVADREGNIGWSVAGHLPRRVGLDGTTPTSWADGTARWDGWLPLDRHPQVYNPASGRVWAAPHRLVGGAELALLGDAGHQIAAPSRQIRNRLAALKELSTESLLDIQLDVRGLYLERWQQLLVTTLDSAATDAQPGRAELRRLAENWGGEAVPSSAGYRLVHDFRAAVLGRVDSLVFARCRTQFPAFDSSLLPLDRIAFTLAAERAAGWHPDGAAGWRQLLLAAADTTVTGAGGAGALDRHTWGEANRLRMQPPLSRAFPWASYFLDMARSPLPGDPLVVRAQTSDTGASVRMVIQPGWEAGSLLHMPGGQSAHPLSPYYSDGHRDWVKGSPTPLHPGKVADHMVVAPPKED